jgi:hypothetical protein
MELWGPGLQSPNNGEGVSTIAHKEGNVRHLHAIPASTLQPVVRGCSLVKAAGITDLAALAALLLIHCRLLHHWACCLCMTTSAVMLPSGSSDKTAAAIMRPAL